MSRALGGLVLKGVGLFVLVFLILSVVATIAGIVLGILAVVVSLLVTVAVLGLLGLAGVGLVSLLRGGDGTSDTESSRIVERFGSSVGGPTDDADRDGSAADEGDPVARLHERYVEGEIDEVELEREIDRLYRPRDGMGLARDNSTGTGHSIRDRDQLRDR